MPGDATIKRQIARLSVQLTVQGKAVTSRGTGFLIGPRLLVTAYHVIGDRKQGRLYGPIAVEFAPGDPARAHTTTAVVAQDAQQHDQCDPALDWALLACAADVPGAAPFALRPPPARAGDPWRSFGYADGTGDPGMAYTGTITASEPDLQLDCVQAHGKARVPGLSGAPCLVDEHVVGIILSVNDPERTGYPKDGAMFIRSIAAVAARCALVRPLMPPPPPPFVLQVQAELRRPGVVSLLPAAGAVAALPAVDQIDPPRLAPLVAEQLLRRGPRGAVDVLQPLAPQLEHDRADGILDLTASVWIGADAAQVLADAVLATAPRTIIGINAATSELGARFVHRAGYPTAHHPGWQNQLRCFGEPQGERRVDDFVAQARGLVAGLIGCDDAELEDEHDHEHDHRANPLILVVPPPLPPAAAVTRLHATLAMVRLVLLCGPAGLDDLLARFPTATIVRPPLAPDEETRARKRYTRALTAMANCYAGLRPKAIP